MSIPTDFAEAQEAIQASLMATTRAASNIASQDISFHRSLNPCVTASLDEKSRRLLQLTERLLQRSSSSSSHRISLPNTDAIDDKWRSLVDAADSLFERTDACLDEFSGIIQKQTDTETTQNAVSAPKSDSQRLNYALRRPDLPKPQLDFETATYNQERTPFRPFLTKKPHGRTSLEASIQVGANENGVQQYQHPYEHEIKAYSYPNSINERVEPQLYHPFESTAATFVDSEKNLKEMIKELKKSKEIAIDLEHHDYHSYIGLVSLMQISTRDRDWVIDTLKPWRRKLEALNEVFTDPDILKVFHGAHMDVIWLQRDLGLYLVGLFDTHFAARVLGYPGKSLAFLLKRFVNFDAQKQYQTADWRIRPLPSQMLDYARSDTHFLLYVYDCMRNELIDKTALKTSEGQVRDCLDDVLQLSNEQCLQRYEHPFYSDSVDARRNGWAPALARHPGHMTQEQIAVYARLHRWRDTIAREQDESVPFVMPNHVLTSIARGLPTRKAELLALAHPISPLVKQHADTLVDLINDARSNAACMPDMNAIGAAQYGEAFTMGAALKRVQAETQPVEPVPKPSATIDDGSLRLRESRLWRKTPQQPPNGAYAHPQTYKILLGDPHMMQAPTEDDIHSSFATEAQKHTAQAEDAEMNDTVEPADRPIPIVLGKRKSPPKNTDEPFLSSNSEDENKPLGPKKKSKKAQARAERKAKRLADERAKQPNGTGHEEKAAPQDDRGEFAKSKLLLDANKDKKRMKKDAIPSFNPYARAEQAAPGLKRPRMQMAGKSATFKS